MAAEIACAPEFILSYRWGSMRRKKEVAVSRGVENPACSVQFLGKSISWSTQFGLSSWVPGLFWNSLRVSISFIDDAHIGITAAAELGSSQVRRMNAHTTGVRWPTKVCDRRVVHSSPGEGSSLSVVRGQGKTCFSTWWNRQSRMIVRLLKSPVEFLGVEFSNIFCVRSTKWI